MTITIPRSLPFVLALIAGAVLVGATLIGPSASKASDGVWTCYVSDRFPDMKDASEWKGAVQMAEGLNSVASHVPAGEMLVLELPVRKGNFGGFGGSSSQGAPSVLCIKD